VTGSIRAVILKLAIFTLFTLAVTALLGMVIGNIQPFTRFYDVKAEFSDATGLLRTDVVKIGGVTIGKVTGSEVATEEGTAKAVVTLAIRKDVNLPRTVNAAIKFRNLVGQRMVVLVKDRDEPGGPVLPKDGKATIPLDQTSPAFDLGIVFNNLKPALQTLDADAANLVARAVVQIFAGREQRIKTMVADLADLADSIAARGPVVADLVTNLNTVVKNLADHDQELDSVLGSFDQILASLGGRSTELARALDGLGTASEGLAEVIGGNRPGLDRAIGQLETILAIAAKHKSDLDATLKALPGTTHAISRGTTYGEWANLHGVCVAGLCAPGFSSTSVRSGGVPDILAFATGARSGSRS
jgi:phospholipid/cholesterol/gamma-HCH transport system substrate-binding protein